MEIGGALSLCLSGLSIFGKRDFRSLDFGLVIISALNSLS